jgi:hypothetical protein
MTDALLCILLTPSASGLAWRDALIERASRLGWPITDRASSPGDSPLEGLVFVHDASAMEAFPVASRAVLIDTAATDTADPSLPATLDTLILRSQILVQAEIAATAGATVLNAARYALTFPTLGLVERREEAPYRIHPSVSDSPLACFDDVRPEGFANWSPRWFTYPDGYEGSDEEPQIDMTGRMRPMVHGPSIYLPAGRWRVDLNFTVDPEKAHAPLLFEWGSGVDFSRIVTEIRFRGAYSVGLDRIWDEPQPVQLRIWPAHPVFQGRFGFRGCRVTRVALDDPAPPTPTDRIVEAAVS